MHVNEDAHECLSLVIASRQVPAMQVLCKHPAVAIDILCTVLVHPACLYLCKFNVFCV